MIWFQRCLLQSCGRSRRRRRGMGTVRTATVRGARRSPCKVSRVFSRRPGVAFRYLRCVSDSLGAADRGLGMREMSQPRLALEVARTPQEGSRSVCSRFSATCKDSMGAGASAGQCPAAAAGECVFGSVFADGTPPGTALLWPCLLMPMVKGTAAGHQQALAAQAEQRRIRGGR